MNSVATDEKKPPEGVVLIEDQYLTQPSREVLEAELVKISKALNSPSTSRDQWGQYYAAQQAINWALGVGVASPVDVIEGGKVQPPMDTDTHLG